MNKRLVALLGIVVVFGAVFVAQKYMPEKKETKVVKVAEPADQKSVAVLTAAAKACSVLKTGSYDVTYHCDGAIAYSSPKITAKVMYDTVADSLRVTGTLTAKDGTESQLDQALDGETVAILDHQRTTLVHSPYPGGRRLMLTSTWLMVPELGDDSAFQTALTRSCKHEGTKEIDGTMCDVVFFPQAAGRASRWFIGTEDHLPRRIESIYNHFSGNEDTDKKILTLASIQARADLDPATFVLAAPEGYGDREVGVSRPLLAVGTPAPAWSLKSPSGEAVKLADLRGQVVVMDFWATWCAPCKMAMPGLQALHDDMQAQGVAVVGINTSELPSGDPEGYMTQQGYTYALLMQGDSVANQFHADGLPTIYVIDGNGAVAYAASGYGDGMDEALRSAVESALEAAEEVVVNKGT